jgi:flagellar FliL protein
MAEENEEIKVEKKSSPITKIILFGVPAFIVQLILVYFITANILINKVNNGAATGHGEETVSEESSGHEEGGEEGEGSSSSGQFIYSIDEVVVNPANTNGRQLLLTSLAFDLASEENKTELEGKEFLVKDMIISVLSSKSPRFLNDITQRDSLRNEISNKIEGFIPGIKIKKVYFSKYILQ